MQAEVVGVGLGRAYRINPPNTYNGSISMLVRDGLTPISSEDYLKLMLEALNSRDIDKINSLLGSLTAIGDKLAHYKLHSDEGARLRIIPYSAEPKITDDFMQLIAPEFSEERLKKAGLERPLTREEVVTPHPFWFYFAGGSMALLKDFARDVYAKLKERRIDAGMGVYTSDNQNYPHTNPLYISDLGSGLNALGNRQFGEKVRMIGLSQQPPVQGGKPLERRVGRF